MSIAKQRAVRESGLYSGKDARKKQIRRERRCFWTFPLGHHYKDESCVFCEKPQDMLGGY